ncbi:flagellar hook protein FlgE [Granulicella rosea]|uniref:Flagellar hook protein FlgE n=1 Tax=Granulicella rosea TaxID=474952 RepID=A0A239EK27_9BACT|nr:flagellar hook protein FlgE [Granulicella rosea]SNS45015.1 flagellar hook protein FlgE [Granulicella rosea]
MPNFSIALTGLQADTVALDTIGNNLANLNTTAFKGQTTTFEDLFYQNVGTTGSGDRLQVGVGTRVNSTSSDFSQGSLTTTGDENDVAISGSGFFVVQQGNFQNLTRAGDFQVDSTGNLITSSGESVMGYGVVGGAVDQSSGIKPITLPVGATAAAQGTSYIQFQSTLDSTAAVGTAFTSPVTVYDSLGASHQVNVVFTKTSDSTWSYDAELTAGTASGTPINNTGTLTFDASGNLVSPAANITGVTFPGMTDGAKDLTFSFNLYNSAGVGQITQTAGTSNTSTTTQDGYTAGAFQSYTVDGNGLISATYSNGKTQPIAQLAMASVTNTDGLVRSGANDYTVTAASGAMNIGLANVGGRGTIEGQALEQSNVDISAEFSDLIVAQRAFEANSKTVTTFDSVTEQAINMIR